MNVHNPAACVVQAASGLPLPAFLTDYQRTLMVQLDAQAIEAGNKKKAQHPSVAELRGRATRYVAEGEPGLAHNNMKLADAFERDVRLAVIPELLVAAILPEGCGRTHVYLYATILGEWLDKRDGLTKPDPNIGRVLKQCRNAVDTLDYAATIATNHKLHPIFAEHINLLAALIALQPVPLTSSSSAAEISQAMFNARKVSEVSARLARLMETPRDPAPSTQPEDPAQQSLFAE